MWKEAQWARKSTVGINVQSHLMKVVQSRQSLTTVKKFGSYWNTLGFLKDNIGVLLY